MLDVLRKFLRYFLTGGVAAIVDIGAFKLLLPLLSLPVAAVVSFCIAAVVNFSLTSWFVFASRPTLRRFFLFFAFASLGLVINAGVTILCAGWLGAPALLAKITGVGTAFIFNFLFNFAIVFRRQREAADVVDPADAARVSTL